MIQRSNKIGILTVLLALASLNVELAKVDAQTVAACAGLYEGTITRVDDGVTSPLGGTQAAILSDGKGCGTEASGGVAFQIFENGDVIVLDDFVDTPQLPVQSIGSSSGCDSAVPSNTIAISFDIETCTLRYVTDLGPFLSNTAYVLAPIGRRPGPPPCPDQPAGICTPKEEASCDSPLNSPWSSAGGGNFFNPDNWLIEEVPSSAFAVLFKDNIAGGGVLSMDADHTSEAFFVDNDVLTLELNAVLYTLTESSECVSSVEIGSLADSNPDIASSQLTVRGGQIDAQSVLIGGDAGSAGTLNLNFSNFNSATSCEIGGDGRGTLEVAEGAVFQGKKVQLARNVFAEGFAKVTGNNSKMQVDQQLIVGGLGSATLEIIQGGELLLLDGATVIIGQGSGANGIINVINEGSSMLGNASITLGEQSGSKGSLEAFGLIGEGGLVNVGVVVVGQGGQGEVIVTALGSAECTQLTLAADERSEGLVRVVGNGPSDARTGITVDQFTVIAESGTASLTIRDGGFINGGAGAGDQVASSIAAKTGSRGTVTVEGEGSLWQTKVLNVGFGGTGELFIRDQANVTSEEAIVGNLDGAIGDIEITSGGIWDVEGLLQVGVEGIGRILIDQTSMLSSDEVVIGRLGVFTAQVLSIGSVIGGPPKLGIQSQVMQTPNVTTNRLVIEQGAIIMAEEITLGPGGVLAGNGEFNFKLNNPGELSPGVNNCVPGAFIINGDYVQEASGQLQIKIGGLEPGVDHDVLIVNGEATLSGTLNISAINDFRPQPGDRFEVLTANTIEGTFDSIGGSGEYEAIYESSRVVLTVLASPAEVAARCIDADSDVADPNDGTSPSVNLCGAGFVPVIGLTMFGFGLVKRHRRYCQ